MSSPQVQVSLFPAHTPLFATTKHKKTTIICPSSTMPEIYGRKPKLMTSFPPWTQLRKVLKWSLDYITIVSTHTQEPLMPQTEHPGILSGVPVPRQAESTTYYSAVPCTRRGGGTGRVKRTSIAASHYNIIRLIAF